jgi:hypothetical protein
MIKKHSTPRSVKQYGVPKTLLIGAVAGILVTMPNGVLASCENCWESCRNEYDKLTIACAEETQRKYNDCGGFWGMILMTEEEMTLCRYMARVEGDRCLDDAWKFRERCTSACDPYDFLMYCS